MKTETKKIFFIPLSEKVPDYGDEVLLGNQNADTYFIGYHKFTDSDGEHYFAKGGREHSATHWIPIPSFGVRRTEDITKTKEGR